MGSEKPSTALAGVAASLPLIFATVGCMILPLASGGGAREATHLAEEMGLWFWVLLVVTPVAAIICGVCLFLAGRGMRVPAVVAVGMAALPWICGVAGMRHSTSIVEGAVAGADPSSRAMMVAKGVAESLNARAFGGWLASGLLAGVGFGLALAAIGQRAPRRSGAGAAVGVAAAVPLAGLAVYALVGGAVEAGMWLLLPALGAFVALALGGFGAGADAAGCSGALAASASVAMVLSFVAAAVAATTVGRMKVFGALAMVDSASRMSMIASGVEEIAPLSTVATWGGLVGLLCVLAMAGWCVMKSRPSAGRIVGAAALVLVAAGVPALDGWADAASGDSLASIAEAPWQDVDGFEPLVLSNSASFDSDAPVAVVTPDGAYFDAERVPIERGALAARFEEALADELAVEAEDAPEWLHKSPGSGGQQGGSGGRYGIKGPGSEADARQEARRNAREAGIVGTLRAMEGAWGEGEGSVRTAPQLPIAVDARLSADALRTLVEAANEAGARSLQIVGTNVEPPPEDAAHRMRRTAPLLTSLSRGASAGIEVHLEGALPEGRAERDPTLYHAEVGAEPEVAVRAREGAEAPAGELSQPSAAELTGPAGYGADAPPSDKPLLYLALGEAATAKSALTAAQWASADYRPVLLAGEIPGNPDEPLVREPTEGGAAFGFGGLGVGEEGDEGTLGLGTRGTLGGGADDASGSGRGGRPDVSGGETDARGSLDKNVIRRVIRRHINEARFCYEQRLREDPKLAGTIKVKFIIAPDGEVRSAVVSESTMNDAQVEKCLTRAVKRWEFPEPEGGGIVVVNYPFKFTSG